MRKGTVLSRLLNIRLLGSDGASSEASSIVSVSSNPRTGILQGPLAPATELAEFELTGCMRYVLVVNFIGALLKFRVTGLSDTGKVDACAGKDFAS